MEKGQFFQQIGVGSTGQTQTHTKNLDTDLTPFTKLAIQNLNVKCKAIQLLKDKTAEKLQVTMGLKQYFRYNYQKYNP